VNVNKHKDENILSKTENNITINKNTDVVSLLDFTLYTTILHEKYLKKWLKGIIHNAFCFKNGKQR